MPTGNVHLVSHPLIQHKLSLMRDRNRSTKGFRELLNEIGMLLCYEVTRDLPLELVDIETPIAAMKAPQIAGKKLTLAPILARRSYRALPRSEQPSGGGILLQGAARFVGQNRNSSGPDAGNRELGLRRSLAPEGSRRQRYSLCLPAGGAGGHRPISETSR
jgi:hypothetical protein